MKGAIKTVSLILGLILLFSAGLLAGAYALATSPADEKEYEVDRISDLRAAGKNGQGPAGVDEMRKKFEKYDSVVGYPENGEPTANARKLLVLFSKEQANALKARHDANELFTLSYEEVTFIVNDSIEKYYKYDFVKLTNANAWGIGFLDIYSSASRLIECYHGDFSEYETEEAKTKYNGVLNDIFNIIVYRLYMLDSSFVKYVIVKTIKDSNSADEGLGNGFGIYVDSPDPVKLNNDVYVHYLKSFAEVETRDAAISKARRGLALCLDFVAKATSSSGPGPLPPKEDNPILLAEIAGGVASIRVFPTVPLAPTGSLVTDSDPLLPTVIFPTPELKAKAPAATVTENRDG